MGPQRRVLKPSSQLTPPTAAAHPAAVSFLRGAGPTLVAAAPQPLRRPDEGASWGARVVRIRDNAARSTTEKSVTSRAFAPMFRPSMKSAAQPSMNPLPGARSGSELPARLQGAAAHSAPHRARRSGSADADDRRLRSRARVQHSRSRRSLPRLEPDAGTCSPRTFGCAASSRGVVRFASALSASVAHDQLVGLRAFTEATSAASPPQWTEQLCRESALIRPSATPSASLRAGFLPLRQEKGNFRERRRLHRPRRPTLFALSRREARFRMTERALPKSRHAAPA